jgi:hypothetical protein
MSTKLYLKTIKDDTMNQEKPKDLGYQSRIRASTLRLARWNGAWVAATASPWASA